MCDRAQWVLAGMSIALSVQLSQPLTAAVPVGNAIQTAQSNSSNAAETALKEGIELFEQGAEAKRAMAKFEQALKLYQQVGDNRGQAFSLLGLGRVYENLGEKQKALEYMGQSLPLSRAAGDHSQEALILTCIGFVYAELGEKKKALEYLDQVPPLYRAVGDHHREASTLYTTASFNRNQNNLTEALNDIESGIKILENLRPTAPSPEVRSSYVATMQEYYEVYIDLLMQLHQANPNSGYDIKASEARRNVLATPKKQRIAVEKWFFRQL